MEQTVVSFMVGAAQVYRQAMMHQRDIVYDSLLSVIYSRG